MNFLVRFTGHLNERIRPEGFPREIWVEYIEELSDENLKLFVQTRLGDFVRQQGMVVPKKQKEMEDETKLTFDKKMFVPMGMIAFIDVQIAMIVVPLPQEVIDGKVQLGEGNTAPLQ